MCGFSWHYTYSGLCFVVCVCFFVDSPVFFFRLFAITNESLCCSLIICACVWERSEWMLPHRCCCCCCCCTHWPIKKFKGHFLWNRMWIFRRWAKSHCYFAVRTTFALYLSLVGEKSAHILLFVERALQRQILFYTSTTTTKITQAHNMQRFRMLFMAFFFLQIHLFSLWTDMVHREHSTAHINIYFVALISWCAHTHTNVVCCVAFLDAVASFFCYLSNHVTMTQRKIVNKSE